jgi:hypothetical protein
VGTLRAVSLLLGPNVMPADEAARAARALVDQLLAELLQTLEDEATRDGGG